jgi:ATP-dependent protease ClpP protease subunit
MRVLHIFEDIEEKTLERVSNFLSEIPDNDNCVIEVCSHGGFVFFGNAAFQKIQEAQARGVSITARVYGIAASSAADIVLACNRVEMAKTATIMIHSAWNDSGKTDRGIEIANEAQLSVIRKRLPDYDAKDLKEDRWFKADEALNIGLIDSIFDVVDDSEQARLCAKYMARLEDLMAEQDDIKKDEIMEEAAEEVVEEVKEEKIDREESPSIEEVLERMVERFDSLEERIRKIEEMNAECGDRRDNARMKAVYDRISAISKPCVSNDSVISVKTENPKAELQKCKDLYPNLDKMVGND